MDHLKNISTRVYPVGRLDFDTTGVLLLTNDGKLTNLLTHPSSEINKTYIATCKGIACDEDLEPLRLGVTVEGVKYSPAKVEIAKINEEKEAEKNAQLVAQNIAKQLQNRIPFRRAMKKVMGDAKKGGVGGIKIQVSGRLGGADMARTEWYKEGRVPLHTLRADIDYGYATAHTSYGCIGVKVWVFKKEVLKKEMNADAGKVLKSPRKDRNFVKKNENNGE
jgi:pseudouridine synthase